MLRKFSDKIEIPVLKTYTLLVKDGELTNGRDLQTNFAIFKKGDGYYAMSLGPFWPLHVHKPKEQFNSKQHAFEAGKITKLENGAVIETGETVFEHMGDRHKFVYEPPYRFNPDNAIKYLKYRSSVSTENQIANFNQKNLSALTSSNKTKAEQKYCKFSDIGGLDDVISELKKFVIRPIKYPEVFQNIRLNKGILLYGPPRCGKTMLGQALANEAGLDFRYKNANEFKGGVVGSSEEKVRDNFDKLLKEPGILFIDEFDAIAKTRDGSSNARYDDSLVNQFLGCMSDLEKSDTLSFVIAATNRKDLIDEAMLSYKRNETVGIQWFRCS